MNKDKLLASAQKYVQKGQFKKAIAEYDKVLEGDPRDVRARLNLANLLLRQGQRERAVETFLGVASIYEDGGFTLKAIAVYKQILKIVPERDDLHVALARNYQHHGLLNEAAAQYREALEQLERKGDRLGKLNVVRRILDLDPDNLPDRLRLAEAYSAMGRISDAVKEFRHVAAKLDEMGYTEDFQRTAERLLYHQPDDAPVAKRLAASYVAAGQPQRALPKLKVAFRSSPRDLEILGILADSFSELGQTHKAVTVLKEMARLYERSGLERERDDCYSEILTLNPDDDEARRAVGPPISDESGETIEFDEETEGEEGDAPAGMPRRKGARAAGKATAAMTPAEVARARRESLEVGGEEEPAGETAIGAAEGASDDEAAAAAEALIEQMIREAIEDEPEAEVAAAPAPPQPPPTEGADPASAGAEPWEIESLFGGAREPGEGGEASPVDPPASAGSDEDLDDFEFELDDDDEEFGFGGGTAERTIADSSFIPDDVLEKARGGVELALPGGGPSDGGGFGPGEDLLAEELQELDFYIDNELGDEARLLLDELRERYPEHPHVKRRERVVAGLG